MFSARPATKAISGKAAGLVNKFQESLLCHPVKGIEISKISHNIHTDATCITVSAPCGSY